MITVAGLRTLSIGLSDYRSFEYYKSLMDARADSTKAESVTADKYAKNSAVLELGRELHVHDGEQIFQRLTSK
jgi:hypothetical protein